MTYNILNVNLKNIRHNVEYLKSIDKKKLIYIAIKANAYGLGAVEIAKYIDDIVDGYCVANICEGKELRLSGIDKEILTLGYVGEEEYSDVIKYGISIPIYNIDIARKINDFAIKNGKIINIHIQVDTGHGRLGFQVNDQDIKKAKGIKELSNLHIKGIFSHFSDAANPDKSYTYEQERKFSYFIKELEKDSIDLGIKHIDNDASLVNFNFNYDMARLGICVYGQYPDLNMIDKLKDLKEAFEWKSIVSNVKYIEKGESVSYARSFIAEKRTKVATICIGYADGYKRILSNKAYLLINGKRARILGLVNMDQTMVDVSDIDCKIGDEAVLIGKSGDEIITCDDLAKMADTISYEIMTSISSRVKRVYNES